MHRGRGAERRSSSAQTVRLSDGFSEPSTPSLMLISLWHALLAFLAKFSADTRFVVAVVGSKGGTLKSVTVAALAHVLAEAGFDVVVGDLEPQGSLTLRCGHARLSRPVGMHPVVLQYVLP